MQKRFNGALWLGLVLIIAGFLSYPLFFYRFPITRDVPWVSYLFFIIAIVLLFIGTKRAFAAGRKIVAPIVTFIGIAIAALFIAGTSMFSKMIPASRGAPVVGAKAPDFTLADTNHQTVALSQLLAAPGS